LDPSGKRYRHRLGGEDLEAPLIPAGKEAAVHLVTALFFLWGIPNNLDDILIRQL